MSLSMGGSSQSQQQNKDPWSGAQPYLLDIENQAQSLYNKGSSYAPFSTVAPFSPTTQAGLNLTTQRALNGSPVVNQADQSLMGLLQNNAGTNNPALQYLGGTASGATLNSNPYIDQNFRDAAGQIGNYINGEFTSGGRGGSGANQDVLERNLNQLAGQMYGHNYDTQVGLQQNAANSIQNAFTQGNQGQLNAAALSPTLAGQDYTDLQALLSAGGAQDQQAQAQLNDLLSRYQYGQQQPWNLLNNYLGAVSGLGGLIGGSGSSTMKGSGS